MKLVTDPELLKQLNSDAIPYDTPQGDQSSSSLGPIVTDPVLLAQLNGEPPPDNRSKFEKGVDYVNYLGDSAGKGLRHAASAPAQFINPFIDYAAGTNLTGNLNSMNQRMDQQYDQKYQDAGIAGKTFSNLGEFMPSMAVGGGALTSGVSKAASFLPKMGDLAVKGGLAGMATAPFVYDESGKLSPTQKLATGAVVGGVLAPAVGGLGQAMRLPSKLLGGQIPREELVKNLVAAKGTETNLGAVTESPLLKGLYENIMPNVLGSGTNASMARTSQSITKKADDILGKYLGNNSPYEIEDKLGEALMKAYKDQSAIKNSLYKNAEYLADKSGLNLNLEGFNQTAKKYSNIINDQNFLKFEPEAKTLLGRLSNFEKKPIDKSAILDKSGNSIETPRPTTLTEANMLAGKLGSLAKKYGASSAQEDRYSAGVLGNLSKSLKNDIHGSIGESGNKDLKKAFSVAENNYKNNFSQFLDKDIYKFINGKKSAEDLVSSFIKTGVNSDKGHLVGKLMNKLDPDAQNLARYTYLSRAIKGAEGNREAVPQALKNLWSDNKLGIKQKRALFPNKEDRIELDNFSKLVEMNPKALNRMHNPPTGHALLSSIPMGMAGYAGALGHGGIAGAVGGLALGAAASKTADKILTSESVRKKLVESILNKNLKQGSGLGARTVGGLIPIIANRLND